MASSESRPPTRFNLFGSPFELFKLLGFPIRVDLSWFFVALLVAWSLAANFFPAFQPGLDTVSYWWMGVLGAFGLFGSVILHELAHAIVARRYGLTIRSITLFIFGGVAEMESEPPSAVAEFAVAIAGPIASLGISVTCFVAGITGSSSDWPAQFNGIAWFLTMVNGGIALFNMLPAFPLDGGRVLRSVIWYFKRDLRLATRVSSGAGSAFGLLMMVYGVFRVVAGGDFIGGLWMFLIGLFLRNASQLSLRRQEARSGLHGLTVQRFLEPETATVPRSIPIRELVENYIYRYHHKLLPVVSHGRLIGCITTARIKTVPKSDWESQSVGTIVEPCSEANSIGLDDPADQAMERMRQAGIDRLMVVAGEELLGVVTLEGITRYLSLRSELEGF